MKTLANLICLTFSLTFFAQNLKPFNGEFPSGKSQSGNATYSFYENPDTHEYLKQGLFKYTFVGKGDYKGYNQTITGSFDKGLKNGLWTYNVSMIDFGTDNYFTGTVTLVANYKNGYADGNWKMIRSYKSRQKLYSYPNYYWGPFGALKSMNVSMNFQNGSIVGNVSINDAFAKFKATGNYDNNSMCIGTWLIDDLGWGKHRELIYKDNVLYEFIARDNNGQVLEGTRKYQDYYDKIIKAKALSESEREEQDLILKNDCGGDDSAATNNIKEYFSKLLSIDYFLYEQIGGDLTFKEGFKGGCELSVATTNFTPLVENNDYKNAEALNDKNKLLEAFNLYSKIDLKTVKPSEIKLVSEKISLIKPKIAQLIATYDDNSKFFSESIKAQKDSLLTDFSNIKKDFKIKSVKVYNKYTYTYDEKRPKEVSNSYCLNPWNESSYNALQCFNSNLEFYEPYQRAITMAFFQYYDALSSEEENVRKSRLYFEFDNTDNELYTYDKSTFINNLNDAKKGYTKSKLVMNLINNSNEKKAQIATLNDNNKKKILFKKQLIVYDDAMTKYNAFSGLDETIIFFNELNKIMDNTILYYSQDTKSLEEKLKEVETVEQIKSLLLE
jgi:hypothetical protein